jgi:hypothetical protein
MEDESDEDQHASANADVKACGQMMVTDHTNSSEELKAIALNVRGLVAGTNRAESRIERRAPVDPSVDAGRPYGPAANAPLVRARGGHVVCRALHVSYFWTATPLASASGVHQGEVCDPVRNLRMPSRARSMTFSRPPRTARQAQSIHCC